MSGRERIEDAASENRWRARREGVLHIYTRPGRGGYVSVYYGTRGQVIEAVDSPAANGVGARHVLAPDMAEKVSGILSAPHLCAGRGCGHPGHDA